ncbi:MAG: hypothetical protein ABIY90_05130 [Puia sp.]
MKNHILFFIVSGFLFCARHKATETGNDTLLNYVSFYVKTMAAHEV